jgi:hypothetical protein
VLAVSPPSRQLLSSPLCTFCVAIHRAERAPRIMPASPFLDLAPSSGYPTLRRPQRLPPEVWGRVARYLADGPTLLALRAVCSDCTAEVTPLAFRVVCVHNTPASVQRLERLRTGADMEHLFRHVRQARILYRAERPPAPPKRRSRLGQSFARLLHRREELAPAPDLGRETCQGKSEAARSASVR